MSVVVRQASPEDAAMIAEFNIAMALETEDKHLSPAVVHAGVAAVFEQSLRGCYYVVESAGQLLACLLTTYEWSDWRNGPFWWIQSVYVVPEARRQGVFSLLYQQVRADAVSARAVGLRLYVEHENQRAQQTYRQLGMQFGGYHVYEEEF